eukprot:4850482-Pyramimonas_sp.AAC.1
MDTAEMPMFQGMKPEDVPWEGAGISKTQINAAIGNSMSVNVLQRLLPRVAYAAGLVSKLR